MNTPPTYVAIVLPPFVRLHYVSPAARARLTSAGLQTERHGGYDCIRFTDIEGQLLSNESFVDTFDRLNRAGILFGEDFTQGWAPADIMREFQSTGRISAPFTAIAWRGPDNWFTTPHDNSRNA